MFSIVFFLLEMYMNNVYVLLMLTDSTVWTCLKPHYSVSSVYVWRTKHVSHRMSPQNESSIFDLWHIYLFNLKTSRRSCCLILCAAVIRNSTLVVVWVKSVDSWGCYILHCNWRSHPLSFVRVFLGSKGRGELFLFLAEISWHRRRHQKTTLLPCLRSREARGVEEGRAF